MGYFIIIMVGIVWLLTLLTSLKGWYKLILLIVALLFRSVMTKSFRDEFIAYVNRMLESDDQDMYVLFGGKNPDTTISSRVGYECEKLEKEWKLYDSNWHQAEKVIDFVFFWQPKHCRSNIERDEKQI